MVQAWGRGREVRRTVNNPLQIDLIASLPLPLEVDEFVKWADVQPGYLDILAARGVVIDAEPMVRGYWSTVAAALPDLYVTAAAARSQNRRSRGHSLIIHSLYANDRVSTKSASAAAPEFSYSGRAIVRVGRYAVPVLFMPDCDLVRLFGQDAQITVTDQATEGRVMTGLRVVGGTTETRWAAPPTFPTPVPLHLDRDDEGVMTDEILPP